MTTGAGGPGGAGLANSITGSPVTRAGGGGGGCYWRGTPGGSGGSGGGGPASPASPSTESPFGTGTPGSNNLGAGGGSGGTSGSGGSGIVVIRIPAATAPATLAVAPGTNTLATDGPTGDQIATFTVSGTITI
jgi:hypothetical protein